MANEPSAANKFYETGKFPRRIVVDGVPLRCGVYSDRMTIGCVAFSRAVIENLLAEMDAAEEYRRE